jgi:ribosomal protein S18 acetylase RimI-like enzyme
MKIRLYNSKLKGEELSWVRCRVLSFLDSAYFDDVKRTKEKYENPAIELVAEIDNKIVGLIDVEFEKNIGDVAYKSDNLGAVIWHLAVLPEYRNQGIASNLLKSAIEILHKNNIEILQAWTRDDKWVLKWYKSQNFKWKESYLHVFAEDNECDEISKSQIPKLYICTTFAHYVGEEEEKIKKQFKRVHQCNLFERNLI